MLHGFFPTPGPNGRPGHAPYAWIARMDEMSSYGDVEEVVGEIVKLAESNELLTVIREAGYSKPEEAAEILRGRAKVLAEELREWLDNKLPNQARLLDRRPERLAA